MDASQVVAPRGLPNGRSQCFLNASLQLIVTAVIQNPEAWDRSNSHLASLLKETHKNRTKIDEKYHLLWTDSAGRYRGNDIHIALSGLLERVKQEERLHKETSVTDLFYTKTRICCQQDAYEHPQMVRMISALPNKTLQDTIIKGLVSECCHCKRKKIDSVAWERWPQMLIFSPRAGPSYRLSLDPPRLQWDSLMLLPMLRDSINGSCATTKQRSPVAWTISPESMCNPYCLFSNAS